jgi:hypothetical protein
VKEPFRGYYLITVGGLPLVRASLIKPPFSDAVTSSQGRPVLCAATKGGGCGGTDFLRLAVGKGERLGLVYAQEPVIVPCGDALRTTRALLPHPLQRLGEWLAAEALRLLRKLANGEVCLLLAGARATESYTPHLYDCSTGAGALSLASHLARDQHRRLGQENLLPKNDSTQLLLVLLSATPVTDQRWLRRRDERARSPAYIKRDLGPKASRLPP